MARAHAPLADHLSQLAQLVPGGERIDRFMFVVDPQWNVTRVQALADFDRYGGATPETFQARWDRILATVQRDWVNIVLVAILDGTAVLTVERLTRLVPRQRFRTRSPNEITVNLGWYDQATHQRRLVVPTNANIFHTSSQRARTAVVAVVLFVVLLALTRSPGLALIGPITSVVTGIVLLTPNRLARLVQSKGVRDQLEADERRRAQPIGSPFPSGPG